jgi:hypothetical protein
MSHRLVNIGVSRSKSYDYISVRHAGCSAATQKVVDHPSRWGTVHRTRRDGAMTVLYAETAAVWERFAEDPVVSHSAQFPLGRAGGLWTSGCRRIR